MHSSWLYYITGISGYVVESQTLVRNGKERRIRDAHKLIRAYRETIRLGGFLTGDCPIELVLGFIDIILKQTAFLDTPDKPTRRLKSRCRDAYIVIRIKPRRSENDRRSCPHCDSKNLNFRKGKIRRFRCLDYGRVKVYVEVEVRRIFCKTCNKTHYEKLPFITSDKSRITRALEWEIFELRANMSISAVADWLDLDWSCVKQAEKRILAAKYKTIDLKKARVIGIDEMYVFGHERSNRKYITIVRDMESGDVLNVSRGKGSDALRGFASRLKRQGAEIQCVCMDMSNAYGKWVRENLPKALIVYDHFHVIKAMNDRLNQIRRKAMARIFSDVRRCIRELDVTSMAREDVLKALKAQEERKEYARETLKGNRNLLLMNAEKLDDDPKAKKRLDRMLEENSDLGKAYVLKEKLRGIYSQCKEEGVARGMFKQWIEEARASEVSEMRSMAAMVETHLDGIVGFWKYPGANNAKTEGFNNKIRWLIKQAYGYRDYKYFRLKILDLPNHKSNNSDC